MRFARWVFLLAGGSGVVMMLALPESEMPPRAVRDKFPALSPDEVALLRAWVDQGAEWPAGVLLTSPQIENQRLRAERR